MKLQENERCFLGTLTLLLPDLVSITSGAWWASGDRGGTLVTAALLGTACRRGMCALCSGSLTASEVAEVRPG